MKVLLVYPYMRDVYHKLGFILPPLGLGYLAAAAKQGGFEVEICDLNITEGKGVPRFAPFDVVGISLDTSRFNSAVTIARSAISEGATVIMGGPHATFVAEEILKSGLSHYIVRGEGEETFVELLNGLSAGKTVGDVSGISYLLNGKVSHTPDRTPPEKLDALAFPARGSSLNGALQEASAGRSVYYIDGNQPRLSL